MEIVRLAPADQGLVGSWIALHRALPDPPDFPEPCERNLRSQLVDPWPGQLDEYWVAVGDGRVLGTTQVSLRQQDNLENADIEVEVHPEHRRRGVGRALLAHAVERARGQGRRRLIGQTVQTRPGGPARSGAGAAFASQAGAKLAQTEVRSRLDLSTMDEPGLARLLIDARSRSAGYTVRQWVGTTPDDLVAGIAALDSRFLEEAPLGDLAYEPEKVDVARARAVERVAALRGRRKYHTVACHDGTGEVVAWTLIDLEHCPDDHGWQEITLVLPEHRGHRLGLLVKLENLALVRSREPELRVLDTWNAEENAHMRRINEIMGFRPVDDWPLWQLEI